MDSQSQDAVPVSNNDRHRSDARRQLFDRIVLEADAGSYGLKGFRDAVIFRFAQSVSEHAPPGHGHGYAPTV